MTSLLDKMAAEAEAVQTAKKSKDAVTAAKARLAFDSDTVCPECGAQMKRTSVAGPLPAMVCFQCRICLPGLE